MRTDPPLSPVLEVVACPNCTAIVNRQRVNVYHPAGRTCTTVPPRFYVAANGAIRLRAMMTVYGG